MSTHLYPAPTIFTSIAAIKLAGTTIFQTPLIAYCTPRLTLLRLHELMSTFPPARFSMNPPSSRITRLAAPQQEPQFPNTANSKSQSTNHHPLSTNYVNLYTGYTIAANPPGVLLSSLLPSSPWCRKHKGTKSLQLQYISWIKFLVLWPPQSSLQ